MSADLGWDLVIDWIRCDGYGLCGDLVPDIIGLDDWRYPLVHPGPIPNDRRHEVQRAVDCCPMRALKLVRAGSMPRR
ncbi:MAG: ferredoxin [Chloroflexota bacterium]|nr:MAG: ferredoxin [Chloroflexota bacterium]